MDKSQQEMDNKIPADEMGGLRCSDLDVPLFKTKDFTKIAITYLRPLTKFQWKLLANEFIEPGTIKILSSMLFDLVNAVTAVIYQQVAPQVKDRLRNLPVPDPSNTERQSRIEFTQERHYGIVTEDNIHASIRDSLHFCFGETLGVKQWKTQYSEQLTELFVAEVTKGVNRKLSCTCHLPQLSPFRKSDTKDMIYYVSRIYSRLIREDIEAPEDSNVTFIFPLSNRDAFTIRGDQECSDNVLPEDLKSLLRQQGFVLSDGGDAESPGDLKCPYKGLCPQELGPKQASTEINSTLEQEKCVLSGRGDVESPVDLKRLEELLSSFEFDTEEATETNSKLDQEGFVLSGGGNVEPPEDPEYLDEIPKSPKLSTEEATETNFVFDQEEFDTSSESDDESPMALDRLHKRLCSLYSITEAVDTDSIFDQEEFDTSSGGDLESPMALDRLHKRLCSLYSITEAVDTDSIFDQEEFDTSSGGDLESPMALDRLHKRLCSLDSLTEAADTDFIFDEEEFDTSSGGDLESPMALDRLHKRLCSFDSRTEEAADGGDVRAQGDQECLDRDSSEACCPDKVTYTEVLSVEDCEVFVSEHEGSVCSDDPSESPSASSTKESLQEEKTLLTTFLGNLLSHIAKATKTSAFDVDLDEMVEHLNNRIVGKIILPQTLENTHIPIYKQLCHMFGSAKKLHAAVVTREAVFIDAVARSLEVELLKSSKEPISFATKVKRFFGRKKHKVASSYEINTTESHSAGKKQKPNAIIRMFRFLCMPFSCCISSVPED